MSKENISQRKLDGYIKLAEIIQWGRKNPIGFVERFFGIELLDYQKYAFTESWSKPFVLWCMSRNAGKSTLGSPFIMAKSLLIPNFQAYILAGVGSQSQEMFMKIEKIAKREIASFTGLTDVFANELVKSASNTTGFTHNPASFQYKLYNGSIVNSLNGNYDNLRSKRSNCNFYDESGFAPDQLFEATEPFTTQNSDFKLGGDVDVTLSTKQMPNQLIYASSASATDTYFFKKYSDFAKKMFLGDKRYFVADINSDVVINATFNGKLYPVSLLTQDKVDAAMRNDKEKAMREYGNIFVTEGADNQIIKRAMIIRNSELRPPTLANDGTKKFIMAVDPARSNDNSICTIGEIYEDENVGYKLILSNSVSWTDLEKKNKTPIKTPDQIKDFKRMLLNYNGNQAADYENIEMVLIDSGAGGAGMSSWGDGLLEDWKDDKGVTHKGLIDKKNEEYKSYIGKYPNASDKVRLLSPKKYKNEMFEALIEMLELDLISFTESYDHKGVIVSTDENGEPAKYKLTQEEEMSLINLDLAKEELVSIYSFKSTNGSVRYDLPPDKQSKVHDDRAYTIAMLAWYLQQLRRKNITNKNNIQINPSQFFLSQKPKQYR
ncbi:terminase [Ureibacillus chungkukjangi]|uniref:terminase n=1 Tax=Ureibacillus chungkukjangi TaxID=1202712 RepID=UPI00203B7F26|nr:terminase [Ureibacillus chungkukjangi]MCM3387322.1 terminase [Ureibacillus chungkukjangi]